jgi:hypothetical protein
MAYADHFSRKDLVAAIAERRTGNVPSAPKKAAERHLADLAASGRLGRIVGLGGRRIRVADAWNGLLGDKVKDFEWALANALSMVPLRASLEVRFDRKDRNFDRPMSDAEIDETYARVCRMMDDGDLQTDRFHMLDDLEDSITGDRIRIEVRNWQPTLLRLDTKGGYAWVPATDAAVPDLVAAEMSVPSGDLLVTDFLRVDGIGKATDEIESRLDGTICADAGQAEYAEAYASQAGMGYAQTENTTVGVFRRRDGRAIAIFENSNARGEFAVKSDEWERVGSVGCGMWRVTLIDLASAIELAARGGNADAANDVERHLALAAKPDAWQGGSQKEWREGGMAAHSEQCDSRNVLRLSVEPGVWTMRCGTDFTKRFPRKSIGLPRGGKLWCVLEFARASDVPTAIAA